MKDYAKVCYLDIYIKDNATADEYERYDALLCAMGVFLFKKRIGGYEGRETAIGKPLDGYRSTNFYGILARSRKKVESAIVHKIANFSLQEVVAFDIGKPWIPDTDMEAEFKSRKSFEWRYT
jgi:hypothetical protein